MKSLYKAENGTNGASKCCHGKDAPNLSISVSLFMANEYLVLGWSVTLNFKEQLSRDWTLVLIASWKLIVSLSKLIFGGLQQVPVGTVFRDEKGIILADLKKEGEIYVAARGGAGGKGNHFFLSNEDRAPMVFEEGGKPETKRLDLELRIVAHVGLVSVKRLYFSYLILLIHWYFNIIGVGWYSIKWIVGPYEINMYGKVGKIMVKQPSENGSVTNPSQPQEVVE